MRRYYMLELLRAYGTDGRRVVVEFRLNGEDGWLTMNVGEAERLRRSLDQAVGDARRLYDERTT
jgi:hypothetical protein